MHVKTAVWALAKTVYISYTYTHHELHEFVKSSVYVIGWLLMLHSSLCFVMCGLLQLFSMKESVVIRSVQQAQTRWPTQKKKPTQRKISAHPGTGPFMYTRIPYSYYIYIYNMNEAVWVRLSSSTPQSAQPNSNCSTGSNPTNFTYCGHCFRFSATWVLSAA